MDPDDYKQDWQARTARARPTIDAELLLGELRRNRRNFNAMIFWRDVREVGVSLLMVPLWLYLGIKNASPWTWYLTVPALVWIAGYMIVDRMRHDRRPPDHAEPLRRHVEDSMARVEHQIRLLRGVFWWALLPLGLAMLAFFGQVAWQERSGGWGMAVGVSGVIALAVIVLAGVYLVNQYAVRAELEPRRRELETLLLGLRDEPPGPAR